MRKEAKKNLVELAEMMKENGLFLATAYKNGYPQLIVTNLNPKKNPGAVAKGFFLFPYVIPHEGILISTPRGILELNIHSTNKVKKWMPTALMNSFVTNFDRNMEKLGGGIKKPKK